MLSFNYEKICRQGRKLFYNFMKQESLFYDIKTTLLVEVFKNLARRKSENNYVGPSNYINYIYTDY